MNSRRSRATRAIVATLSLLATLGLAVPWVDEYLRLRSEAVKISQLEHKFAEQHQRNAQLNRIEAKLTSALHELNSRSIDPSKTESVREQIVEIVRLAGGRIRRLEISEGEHRVWATENDTIQSGTMPLYSEESEFELHTHLVELQADGSLAAIQQILSAVGNQTWLMTTRSLGLTPTTVRESPVSLDLELVVYGLTSRQLAPSEEFAKRPIGIRIR